MSLEHDRACSGILLVEDDAEIVEMMTLVLEDEGHKVIVARDGREALDFLRANAPARPCIILLDLMMPGMNGIDFRSEQLRDPALAAVPVVLVTADRRARLVGVEMKVAATLVKPVNLDELLAVVERYCERASG